MTELQLKKDLSDAFAKDSTSAIKKHALRLKESLSLPKTDNKETIASETLTDGTRKSLSALCRHIYEFITNPIFETTTGMNVEHSAKAGQSLEAVIRFAEKIAAN